MTRRPGVIRLGPLDIRVRVQKQIGDYADANGTYDHDKKLIEIDPRVKPGEDTVGVVLHELIHAMIAISALHDRFPERQKDELEEALAWSLGNQLVELFKRNPALVRWVVENLSG